ncbi:ATP-binding cassette domain-containing protein, partial [Aquamicrobium terrae]
MSAPVLSVRDLTVNLDLPGSEPRMLLDKVSVDLGKGEVLGLVGESGSGKSLFCRTVRRRNIWRRFGVALTESGPRQGLAFRRRACG